MKIPVEELRSLVQQVLVRQGMVPAPAPLVAATIVAAERDGSRSHGLQRLSGYLSSLRCGWVDGAAEPVLEEAAPGLLKVDARNGFAQVALADAAPRLCTMAARQGSAAMAMSNSHHFGALWPDIEPLAMDGFIALTMVSTRARMVVWVARRRAGHQSHGLRLPRRAKPPIVWDQASSVIPGRRAAGLSRPAPAASGRHRRRWREGQATTDPDAPCCRAARCCRSAGSEAGRSPS